jgi:hypothetical protein
MNSVATRRFLCYTWKYVACASFPILKEHTPIWHIYIDRSCRNVPITFALSVHLLATFWEPVNVFLWTLIFQSCSEIFSDIFFDYSIFLVLSLCSLCVFHVHSVSVSVPPPFHSNIYLLIFTGWNSSNPATMLINLISSSWRIRDQLDVTNY